jgi:hypothetical protein
MTLTPQQTFDAANMTAAQAYAARLAKASQDLAAAVPAYGTWMQAVMDAETQLAADQASAQQAYTAAQAQRAQ